MARFSISEKQLRELYSDQLLTESEIAERLGTTQRVVSYWRGKYKIPTVAISDRTRLPPLNETQEAMLLGSILGDCRLFKTGSKTAAYSEHHCLAQEDYLMWKAEIWGEYVCSIRKSDKVEKSGTVHRGKILRTHASKELFPIWEKLYTDGKGYKTFEKLDFSKFNGLSLAVWLLDDGKSTSNGYFSFSVTPKKEDHEVLMGLLRRFDLDPKLYFDGTDYTIWVHGRSSITRMIDLISPHIPKSMSYKIDLLPRSRGLPPREVLTEEVLSKHLGEGRTATWVAESFNVPRSSVTKIMRRYGISTQSFNKSSTTEEWDAAKLKVVQGISDSELLDVMVSLSMPEAPSVTEAIKDYNNLCNKSLAVVEDGYIKGGGTIGLKCCLPFFQYRLDASNGTQPSLRRAWFDPEWVKKAIEFQKREGDPLFPKNIFRALKYIIRSPSNFRPAVAKKLVELFCPEGGLVLDPCAGYGGRAVGTLASGRKYFGVDPHPKAKQAYERLSSAIGKDLTFINSPFEDVDLGSLEADLILTSPPYFNVERYSDDVRQSWVRYPTWDMWKDRFLRVLLSKSYNHLKSGAFMLLNISDAKVKSSSHPLVETSIEIAKELGLTFEGSYGMILSRTKTTQKSEPVLIFSKSNSCFKVPISAPPLKSTPPRLTSYKTSVEGLTRDELYDLYHLRLLTCAEIAKLKGVSDVLVSQQLKRHNIETMSPLERKNRKSGVTLDFSNLTPDELRDLSKQYSDIEIGKKYGVSKTTIRKLRKKFGILATSKTERASLGKYKK